MFSELPGLVEEICPVRIIIDIGTGYGVPAAWFLERFPEVKVFGLDPDKERIRNALDQSIGLGTPTFERSTGDSLLTRPPWGCFWLRRTCR